MHAICLFSICLFNMVRLPEADLCYVTAWQSLQQFSTTCAVNPHRIIHHTPQWRQHMH